MSTVHMAWRPTAEKVHRAFGSAGLGPITFATVIHRNGPGWQFVINLPANLNAAAVAPKNAALARSLGVNTGRLVIDRARCGPEHRIEVWILDQAAASKG